MLASFTREVHSWMVFSARRRCPGRFLINPCFYLEWLEAQFTSAAALFLCPLYFEGNAGDKINYVTTSSLSSENLIPPLKSLVRLFVLQNLLPRTVSFTFLLSGASLMYHWCCFYVFSQEKSRKILSFSKPQSTNETVKTKEDFCSIAARYD